MGVATVVETSALLQTIAASIIAGVGVTIAFSIGILGAARSADLARDGRRAASLSFATLAAVAMAACAAAVVIGIIVMTTK